MSKQYSRDYRESEKRALNIVWTAADSYDFHPLFLSFLEDDSPNFYFNFIIGLVHKWFDAEKITALFQSYAGDTRQERFDSLLWLALENAVYEKEVVNRPVLASLRKEYASHFFDTEQTMSRQQWMAQNNLTYAMQAARWSQVLDKKMPFLSPGEKSLSHDLCCNGSMDTDEIVAHIHTILHKYYQFNGTVHTPSAIRIHVSKYLTPLLARFMKLHHRTEQERLSLPTRLNEQQGNSVFASPEHAMQSLSLSSRKKQRDLEYIEDCFGASLCSLEKRSELERTLCTDNHAYCHIWLTKGGEKLAKNCRSAEAKVLAHAISEQYKANELYFQKNIALHQSNIKKLQATVQNLLLVAMEPTENPAKAGNLISSKSWRASIVKDPTIFFTKSYEEPPKLTIDLLLDASASRMHVQDVIATQGYIIAESLERCGLPVQIFSFCSIRGYTVLHTFKDSKSELRNHQIFHYFATGWNRDGLALRCLHQLIQEQNDDRKHIVITLTDASPNDDYPIPPKEHSPFSQSYSEEAAINDTLEEIKHMRQNGIQVAAIFTGLDQNVETAKKMYGKYFARIQSMDRMADATSKLMKLLI